MTDETLNPKDALEVISNRVRKVTYDSNGGRIYSGTYDMFVTSDGQHFTERENAVAHERDIILVKCLTRLGEEV